MIPEALPFALQGGKIEVTIMRAADIDGAVVAIEFTNATVYGGPGKPEQGGWKKTTLSGWRMLHAWPNDGGSFDGDTEAETLAEGLDDAQHVLLRVADEVNPKDSAQYLDVLVIVPANELIYVQRVVGTTPPTA